MVNTMSLLLGPMRQHIPGFKELSEHKDIIEVRPGKEILIPLFANHSQNFELLVKEGVHRYETGRMRRTDDGTDLL